ncbi:hypothetical protein LC967_14485, partial [Enterococcus faecium]|nr:hypothetical protein [Enterococcus faecium]
SFLLLSFSIILPYLIVDLKLCNRTRELKKYFNDLKVTKIKAKKGNKIAKLEFTFSSLTSDLPKISLRNWLEE